MRICFLIRSLGLGGAERQLATLAALLHKAGHDVTVLTFYDHGSHGNELRDAGVRVVSLGKSGRWDLVGPLIRLVRIVSAQAPHLLHGYLPTGNLLALAVRPFLWGPKIAWGVRSSRVDLSRFDAATLLTYRVERRLARFADLIVANSQAGADLYRRASGGRTPVAVVPNGFDLDAYAPDAEAGASARAELGVGQDELVIGMVARIDPMKDHDTFLEAAALALERRRDLRFVCVGGGPLDATRRLRAKAGQLGIADSVLWLGERRDVPSLYNAFDIATLASKGEGFSNVIAEALACGVPCVASDVGAARQIVGDYGLVTPPGDARALAEGWMTLLDRLGEAGTQMRRSARLWIVNHYGLDALAHRSLAAFRSVVGGDG